MQRPPTVIVTKAITTKERAQFQACRNETLNNQSLQSWYSDKALRKQPPLHGEEKPHEKVWLFCCVCASIHIKLTLPSYLWKKPAWGSLPQINLSGLFSCQFYNHTQITYNVGMAIYSSTPTPELSQDVTIAEGAPTTNDGSNEELFATLYAVGDARRALIKFDLSSISTTGLSTSNIVSATLTFISTENSVIRAGSVYRILSGNRKWNEFTATWNTQNGVDSWAGSVGCGTSGTDYSSTAMGTYANTAVAVGSARTITLSDHSELLEMIRANYGMVIISDEGGDDKTPVGASAESSGGVTFRPTLTITYFAPSQNVANDAGSNGYGGYHTDNVELGGSLGALYNGSDTYTDITTTGLASGFVGDEATVIVQCKPASGFTTNSAVINLSNNTADPNDNTFSLRLFNSGTTWRYTLKTDNTTFKQHQENVGIPAIQNAYSTCGLSWSDSNNSDRFEAYLDGASINTQSGLDVWDGTINAATSVIGAGNSSAAAPFSGHIRNVIIGYSVAASDANHTTIYDALIAGTLTTGALDTIFGSGLWSWWSMDETKTTPTAQISGATASEILGADLSDTITGESPAKIEGK